MIKNNNNSMIYLLSAIIFIIYLLCGFGVTISNDSVTNIQQISSLDIWSRSSHFSFHLFGVLFYVILNNLFQVSAISSVEIMLSFFSVIGSIALYYIVLDKFDDRKLSLITFLIYSFSSGVFRFSIQSEYLILVPSLALISIALYVKRFYFFSGIFFAFGLLTSAFILFIAPYFIIYNNWKTLFSKKNYLFIGGFLILYIPISLFTFSETISGHWSYMDDFNFFKEVLSIMSYLRIGAIFVYGYLRSFIIVIPFAVIGLWTVYKIDRKLFYILLIMFLIHLPASIPEARYGGYQLTFYPFVALLSAIGLNKILKQSKVIAAMVVFLYLGVNFYIVLTERNFNRSLRDTYVMLQNDPAVPDSSVLFVYQAVKPIRAVYAPKLQPVGMLTNYQEKIDEHYATVKQPPLKDIINKNKHFYLLESGVSLPDDYIKLLFLSFVENQGAKIKGFGMKKLQPYFDAGAFQLIDKFPIDLYRIQK